MNYINKVCSFTGYRTSKLNAALKDSGYSERDLRRVIACEINKLIDDGYEIFQCGMAIGCDMIFADVVLNFKKLYPSVKFFAFIPCLMQDKSWKTENKAEYNRILEQADDIKLVSNAPYFDGCMQKRNAELVKTCDVLLAVYGGQSGGTANTINYAKDRGVRTIIINPADFSKITLFNDSKRTEI